MMFLPTTYLELYCLVFEQLDRKWREMNATYMQFSSVSSEVRISIETAIHRNSESLDLFRKELFRDRVGGAAPCDRCEEKPAQVICTDCNSSFCRECSDDFHKTGRWKEHKLTEIAPPKVTFLTNTPMPGREQQSATNTMLSTQQTNRTVTNAQPTTNHTNQMNANIPVPAASSLPPGVDDSEYGEIPLNPGAPQSQEQFQQQQPEPPAPSPTMAAKNAPKPKPVSELTFPVNPNDDKQSRLKLEVINEIITTEEDYVADLNRLVEVFLLPIKFKGIVPPEDLNVLFR